MKKAVKITLLTIVCVLVVVTIAVTVFAQTNDITTLEQAKAYLENIFEKEKNAVLDSLSDCTFNEILAQIKELEQSEDTNETELAYYHLALAEKMNTVSKNELTDAILDTELSAESRATIIISAETNEITLNYERLADAIDDDNYIDIRSMLIDVVADATPYNIDNIEKIVANKSEGFHKAILSLWEIKPSVAYATAIEILNDYSGEYDEIFRGAIDVVSLETDASTSDEMTANYIALCEKIFSTSTKDEEEREIYMITCLELVRKKEVLVYCMKKDFGEMMTNPALAKYLISLLDEPASDETIDLLLYYYPHFQFVGEFSEPIQKHLNDNPEYFSDKAELKEQLEAIATDSAELHAILSNQN